MSDNQFRESSIQELMDELLSTEPNDSVQLDGEWHTGTPEETLVALMQAADEGVDLNLGGNEYVPAKGSHEVRKLRRDLKAANQTIGKQGQTIHLLRAEIAEVRSLSSRAERGEIRYMDRHLARLTATLHDRDAEIERLNDKLAEWEDSQQASQEANKDT